MQGETTVEYRVVCARHQDGAVDERPPKDEDEVARYQRRHSSLSLHRAHVAHEHDPELADRVAHKLNIEEMPADHPYAHCRPWTVQARVISGWLHPADAHAIAGKA